MSFSESLRQAADRLVIYATTQGCDVAPLRDEYNGFRTPKRSMEIWVEDDHFGYNLSGEIVELPSQFAKSQSSFRGFWSEAGSIDNLDQAFRLLNAWLIEIEEVDKLPHRMISRCGI
jgi:hypothetical protein